MNRMLWIIAGAVLVTVGIVWLLGPWITQMAGGGVEGTRLVYLLMLLALWGGGLVAFWKAQPGKALGMLLFWGLVITGLAILIYSFGVR
ncbi:MAG: hypothetical protein KIS81_09635 [Maricaulaceae bacterium]|nr:hypothetical protein [Maricaulaceae bacterium]